MWSVAYKVKNPEDPLERLPKGSAADPQLAAVITMMALRLFGLEWEDVYEEGAPRKRRFVLEAVITFVPPDGEEYVTPTP